jgi:glycosyltransferase involved in cell wall biosynthesis
MACGTPVVATAVGGIPEQIDDGRTGFLKSPGDSEGMAESIGRLLADEELRGTIGDAAAEKARSVFDLRANANSYLQWYKAILQN